MIAALDPLVRFCRLFEEAPSGCYEWQGRLSKHSRHPERGGYAVFRVFDPRVGKWRTVGAAHWIAEQKYGELPPGYQPHHICGNRKCVRPDHLVIVPGAVNRREANERRYASRAGAHKCAGEEGCV